MKKRESEEKNLGVTLYLLVFPSMHILLDTDNLFFLAFWDKYVAQVGLKLAV
jgi:hypothetical protein